MHMLLDSVLCAIMQGWGCVHAAGGWPENEPRLQQGAQVPAGLQREHTGGASTNVLHMPIRRCAFCVWCDLSSMHAMSARLQRVQLAPSAMHCSAMFAGLRHAKQSTGRQLTACMLVAPAVLHQLVMVCIASALLHGMHVHAVHPAAHGQALASGDVLVCICH